MRKKELGNSQKKNKMALVSPYLSIITFNVNELNPPIKRYKVAKKQTQLYVIYKRLTSALWSHTRLKVKG